MHGCPCIGDRERLMRIVLRAAMLGLLIVQAGSVYAQGRMNQSQQAKKQQAQPESESDRQARAKTDADYKNALSHIPDKKPADPWGKMR